MSDERKNAFKCDQMQQCESFHFYDENGKIIFGSLAEGWLYQNKQFFKESTIIKYQNLLKLYLIPEFEHYALEDFTYVRLNEFSLKLLQFGGHKGTGLSPKTVSDIFSLLHNIFQYAENKGISVPASHITIPIKQKKKKIRIFTIEEQKELLSYLMEEKKHTSLGILLCFFTGLRIGEICALKWRDISLEEKIISVRQTMQRIQTPGNNGRKTKILVSSPKSISSIRQIPIPSPMFDLLKKVQLAFHFPTDAFLLTGSIVKYIEPRTLQYQFKRILLKCGIKDANFHAVRHTFATRCIEIGCDVKSLSEILGHSNINITLNCYVHPPMSLKRQNINKLSDLFFPD